MVSVSDGAMVEQFLLVVGLIGVQVVLAVYGVLIFKLLATGLSLFVFIVYGSLVSAVFLSPFAIFCERSKWPRRFSPTLLAQLLFISFGGVTAFQSLLLLGMRNTSPAIASAMPNLAPGIIFTFAWIFGFEKVSLRCSYSRVKILGTIVCLGGALLMSFFQRLPSVHSLSPHQDNGFQQDKLLGCIYLLAAVVLLASVMILQTAALKELPAPVTMCAITSLVGAVLTALVQLLREGKLEFKSDHLPLGTLIFYALAGGAVNGLCVVLQTWAVKKRGPVLVSMFSPIGTVCSVIISALTLREGITLGSLFGMCFMFMGLYFVLWAKNREDYFPDDEDKQKPLLG
ncbi:WAT1-related protein At5g47470-like [Aristolochia californica]|uniref:WAT1-related protein At5g47470-like n=1 Tax=Aristolochia californica TaxID=171875 RepID=UPI0035E0D896